MPRLRRPNAHHRDLQTGVNATDPRATTKGCRMTRRTPKCTILAPFALHSGGPSFYAEQSKTPKTHRYCSQSNPILQSQKTLNRVASLRQLCKDQNQPIEASCFPHRSHPTSHGFLLERFVNAGQDQPPPKPRGMARIEKPSSFQTLAASRANGGYSLTAGASRSGPKPTHRKLAFSA